MALERACEKLDGEMEDDVCIVDGFPMYESLKLQEWEYYGVEDNRSAEGKDFSLEKWKPKKFLRKAGWMDEVSQEWAVEGEFDRKGNLPAFRKESLEELKGKIKRGEGIDPPWVETKESEFIEGQREVVGHEGRHRSLACKDLEKCEKVPVVIKRR